MSYFDFLAKPVRIRQSAALACLIAAMLCTACTTTSRETPAAKPSPPTVQYVPQQEPADMAARHLLAYHATLLRMGPEERAQEVRRLSASDSSLAQMMDLALVLGLTRGEGDLARAQGLLRHVLQNSTEQAQVWHGMAQLLATRYAEQQHAREQAEQVNQRKLEQLNAKLRALISIERSLDTRPSSGPAAKPSAPKPAPAP